jgi:drug/metabolite transporter (DMT)-like permease
VLHAVPDLRPGPASRYHPLQTLSVFLLVAVVALLPITAMNGLVATYPPVAWLLFLYLGLGVSVLGYVCLVLGLRTIPVTGPRSSRSSSR